MKLPKKINYWRHSHKSMLAAIYEKNNLTRKTVTAIKVYIIQKPSVSNHTVTVNWHMVVHFWHFHGDCSHASTPNLSISLCHIVYSLHSSFRLPKLITVNTSVLKWLLNDYGCEQTNNVYSIWPCAEIVSSQTKTHSQRAQPWPLNCNMELVILTQKLKCAAPVWEKEGY